MLLVGQGWEVEGAGQHVPFARRSAERDTCCCVESVERCEEGEGLGARRVIAVVIRHDMGLWLFGKYVELGRFVAVEFEETR